MRDFTWNYFSNTGDVNAYLLYKEIDGQDSQEEQREEELEPAGTGFEIVI